MCSCPAERAPDREAAASGQPVRAPAAAAGGRGRDAAAACSACSSTSTATWRWRGWWPSAGRRPCARPRAGAGDAARRGVARAAAQRQTRPSPAWRAPLVAPRMAALDDELERHGLKVLDAVITRGDRGPVLWLQLRTADGAARLVRHRGHRAAAAHAGPAALGDADRRAAAGGGELVLHAPADPAAGATACAHAVAASGRAHAHRRADRRRLARAGSHRVGLRRAAAALRAPRTRACTPAGRRVARPAQPAGAHPHGRRAAARGAGRRRTGARRSCATPRWPTG